MALSLSYTAVFDLDSESGTVGKFVLTDTSDYAGEGIALADVVGYFRIDYPDGSFHLGSFGSPDIQPATSTQSTGIVIPKDANGDYLEGVYTFQYFVQVSGAVQAGTYQTSQSTFDFCRTSPKTPAIGLTADCFCFKVTSLDNTVYGVPTTTSRAHTIYPPSSLLSAGTASKQTVTGAKNVYSFSYTGTYEAEINTLLTYVTGIFTVKERVKGSQTIDVSCDIDFCGVLNCFNSFVADIFAEAKAVGGINRLPVSKQDKLIEVLIRKDSFDNNLKCGKGAQAQEDYDRLKVLTNCECSCTQTDTPTLVNPYCTGSGSNSTVYDVVGTAPITVTKSVVGSTTTFTVALSQGTIDQINQNTTDLAALDVQLNQQTFNTAVTYDDVISISNTGLVWTITLNDPEGFHQAGDATDPLYDNTPGSEIMVLGETAGYPSYSGLSNLAGNPMKFRRDIRGYVEMRGGASFNVLYAPTLGNGVNVVPLFTLPVGYRPTIERYFPAVMVNIAPAGGTFGAPTLTGTEGSYIRVSTNGDVALMGYGYSRTGSAKVHIDPVNYVAEQ